MTEMQVLALQQVSMGLAAFHRDHLLIRSGKVKLDVDDTYKTAEVELAIKVTDMQLRDLCTLAGKSDLGGVPTGPEL